MNIMEDIIKKARRERMIKLDNQMREEISSCQVGEMIQCPLCRYISKNGRGSAKVFENNTFKCFSCGAWRRLG